MIKDAGSYHIPVLLQECIDGLSIRPDGVYAVSYTHLTLPTKA